MGKVMSKTTGQTIDAVESSNDLKWLISCGVITVLAVALRFVHLGLKPFHHDEGVNGWFLTNLFREGSYKYDPANYHGPTLYYISLAFVNLFGLETLPVRWSVAIWGVLMVVFAFWLRRYIGDIGSLFAALFLALSPGMVYISRYFIHEIFFVFLALAVVVAIVQFIEREKAGPFAIAWTAIILLACFIPSASRIAEIATESGTITHTIFWIFLFVVQAVFVFFAVRILIAWRDGRPIYFLLAASSVALMFATKETGFITLGTMLIAIGCVLFWERIGRTNFFADKPINKLAAIAALPILAAIYRYEAVLDGIRWIGEEFVSGTEHDATIRYLILILLVATFAALISFGVRTIQINKNETVFSDPTWEKFHSAMGSGIDLLLIYLAAAVVFGFVWTLFFTSFFAYPKGIIRSIEAYAIWTKTGTKDHTQSGNFGYLKWMMEIDAPLLIMSALGLVIALFRTKHRFALFAGMWAFGLFIAYSIIPYKTPWLMLSFTLPMCIVAGYAINELATSKELWSRASAGILAILSCVILAWQTYDLNFVNYDNERLPYVYAHTDREFLAMVADIERFAEVAGTSREAKIQIVSPDYWPLVWYLRDYKNAAFHGRMADAANAEVIITKKNQQDAEATRRFGNDYEYHASYKLRPGVELVLFVRKDLAKAQENAN